MDVANEAMEMFFIIGHVVAVRSFEQRRSQRADASQRDQVFAQCRKAAARINRVRIQDGIRSDGFQNRVTGEHQAIAFAQQTATSRSMAWRVNNKQCARSEDELLLVAVSFDIFDGVGEMVNQLVARRHSLQFLLRRARAFEQVVVDPRVAMFRYILKLPFVNVNARAGFALQHSGQPAMVFVRVREDDALDVFGFESELAQLIAQGDYGYVGLWPRIYERDRVVNDQVDIDRPDGEWRWDDEFFDSHEN